MPAGVLDTSLGDVNENSSCEKLSLFQPKQLFIYLFIYFFIYFHFFSIKIRIRLLQVTYLWTIYTG